jgi:hypothetical protein
MNNEDDDDEQHSENGSVGSAHNDNHNVRDDNHSVRDDDADTDADADADVVVIDVDGFIDNLRFENETVEKSTFFNVRRDSQRGAGL